MNNTVKPLFSNHYLTKRLQATSAWQEDITNHFQNLQNLYQQKQNILPTLNESQTENEWIQPILEELGFSYIVQTSLHKSGKIQRPDYSLFLDENSKQSAYNLSEDETLFYSRAVVIADAKYYERPLSEKLKNQQKDTFKNSNPSFQIVNYLDGTRVNWGMLTNGRYWRLYYRLSASPIQQFYEIDLVNILVNNDLQNFKYFWLFFRKKAFIKDSQNLNFLERVKEESNNYAREIEGELKRLVFKEIFANLAGGFVAYKHPLLPSTPLNSNPPTSLRKGGLEVEIYQATLSFLYKILFLLYAEAKNLLPIEQENYREYSLSLLLKNIAQKCDKKIQFSETSTQYYDNLLSLFKIIDKGDRSLNVPAYNGGLFKVTGDSISVSNQFLLEHKLTDFILAPALDQLARIKGEWIDYKFLGVRDLGSIYEGLLEYKLIIEDAKTGKVYLENDKGERRETGSYYTPEYIVNYIVQNTLDSILEERALKFEQLMLEIKQLLKDLQDSKKAPKTIQLLRQDLDKLQKKAYNTLLDIKVCDPAMGSGHFLVTTVDYITRKLINILNNYPENNPILEQLDDIKEDIINNLTNQGISVNNERLSADNLLHRAVMKRCIYGVDLNPMAVELAKVSLWLHSFTVGAPLSFLDHHLRCGNSLIGCMAKDVQNEFISADQTEGFLPLFQTPFHGLLQSANVMQEIANLSDATFAQVEQSQHYFNSFDEQAKPYKKLLDVYISQYFGLKKNEVNSFFRFRLNDLKAKVNKQDQILLDTASNLYQEKRFFHWDLEFPEVFIDLANANWKENGGFDVVLGNPPYGIIFNINNKKYLETNLVSFTRNNDIYTAFCERAIQLLKQQSFLSLIIPNTFILGSYFKHLKECFLQKTQIISIDNFKNHQIFVNANIFTAIILLKKNLSGNQENTYLRECFIEYNKINYIEIEQISLNFTPLNSWKIANSILLKLTSKTIRLDDLCYVKDVGLNYWTKGKGKTRINSLSSRLFYDGFQQNPQDLSFLKGGDFYRYQEVTETNHWLKYNYQELLEPTVDIFRFSQEFLQVKSKIIYRQTADSLIASIDNQGFLVDKTVHVIILRKEYTNYSYLYILSLFNSKLMNYLYQDLSTEEGRTFAQVKTFRVKELPFYIINFTTPEGDRLKLVAQLIEIYKTSGLNPLPLNDKIQQHLKEDQTDVIHDFLAYLAEQMIELNKQKQTEIKDFLTWLSREIGTEIDNLTNKTALKNYLGDYQKSQENLTFEQFLDILKKNRKKLKIDPSERKIQNLIAKEYENSLNALLPIKKQLTYTDKLIDQIVYQLYGLTEDEIAIIEKEY